MPRLLVLTAALLGAGVLTACGVGGFDAGTQDSTSVYAGLPGAGSPTAMAPSEMAYAQEVLRLVNVERAKVGTAPLLWDDGATRAAYAHSLDMDVRNVVFAAQELFICVFGPPALYLRKETDVCVTDPTHAGVVAEQLDGRFQGFEVLGREQDDVLAAVAGDVDALVGAVDLVGDLGQTGLDFRQRHHAHRPE